MTVERRQGVRVPVQIWVEEKTDRELYFQRSANLSTGGIYLENTIPHPVGTRVNLRFSLPGDDAKIEVRAEVAAAIAGEEEFGMGLKFVDVVDGVLEQIKKYIARTGG
jgi:uncharacterized protein (TIGR02266 family)